MGAGDGRQWLMNQGRAVFSQLISFLPDREFRRCVERYRGDIRLRGFSCWDQYLAMAFAQLTYRESLRDIEACLRSIQGKLYHLGFRGKVARSTLADANECHDWRIFADFAQVLIGIARPLHARDPMGVDLEQSLYALDSTTIDLCLSLFPWAKFRRRKAAVKMHTLLDLHGNIPTFIRVTSGDVHDVNILDEIMPEAGAFYVMDRAYIDFQRLYVFTLSSAFFVVRTKSNVLIQRRYSSVITSKAANGSSRPGLRLFYPAASCGGKSVLVLQLRGPHLSTWPWCSKRSSIALTAAASPSSLPQSSTGRLEVNIVLARS